MKSPHLYRLFGFAVALLLSACSGGRELRPIAGLPNADKAYYQKLAGKVQNDLTSRPEDAELRIKLAKYHQSMGWPAAAKENMTALLDLAPKEPRVMVLAADYYINQNDFEQSWVYAQAANKLGSVHPSLTLIQAKYHLSQRKFKEAARYIEQYYRQGGNLPEAYRVGAELALQASDTARARNILEEGVSSNPLNIALVTSLVDLYKQQGAYEAVAALVLDYQSKSRDRASFRTDLLQAYFQLQNFSAGSALVRDWPVATESPLALYGQMFLETQLADSASYYADQILSRDSTDTGGLLLKARYLHKRGRLRDAYAFYTTLLETDSAHQIAREERGIVIGKIAYLRKLREEKAAIPVFDFAPKRTNNQ